MTTCLCCGGESRKFGRFQNVNRVVQRFQCTRCGKTFSESQPLDGLRTEHEKVVQIVKLLAEGVGVRATARLTDCQHKTVLAVLNTVGAKCAAFLDRTVRNVQTGALQIDEIWSRVGISQRLLNRRGIADDTLGDQYTFLAITAREKFIISYHTGKRNAENTEDFVSDFAQRIVGRIQITSDSWRPYPFLVRKYLLERLDYATMQKVFGTGFNNPADPNTRYSPGVCTGVKVKVRAGAPRADRINTSFVERANLSVRHFNKRFARLGLGYSRKLENHRNAISIFIAAYNFCKVHSTLGCTPAVGLKLADEAWTIEKLVETVSATN
jgi:transposase-like protein/IS1 family transposase